ncbi:hypothetical protein RBU61_17245 [Tissierella sp. MB52-C2]|uniref:hypothetical protein n=1 Tax=Tissierella sp. MB52-C2 TaxID=3070999 RepID=UPI00280B7C3D|nr:hypothetical protein [Tissierella sp. MB52-C2]WMM24651.1 hypothetical protein RBU61_17245 [Tissierella sp. MB52-C2]
MKNRKIIFLLIITIFLIGCSEKNEKKEKIQLVEASGEGSTIYQNDNIKIKISDNIDEKESIYTSILNELHKINEFSPIENIEIEISKQHIVPKVDRIIKCDVKFIETEEFKKELIKKSYGIYDNWISEGLYAYIYDIEKKEVDYTTYYTNNDFSLFGARFFEPFSTKEEIDNIKSASRDLVEYLLKNNKKEELLKNNINISDIENWAKEKGIDLGYQRKIESLMNRMEVYDIADKFIINTKEEINGFKIDISIAEMEAQYSIATQYNTAEKIEQIILRFDRDILAIKNGIEQDSPRFYAEYKEVLNNVPKIEYIFDTTNSYDPIDGGFFSKGTDKINLRDINSHAHEYCHLFFYNPFMEKGITITRPKWLNEGIANYLDIIYSEASIKMIEDEFNNIPNYTELLFAQGFTENELKKLKSLYDDLLNLYIKNDIDINNIEEIAKSKNKRIMKNNLNVLYRVKFRKILGTNSNEGNAPMDLMNEGDTMDYHKNFSFFNYLVEEYGLEKMLYLNVTDFNGLTYKEVFGKTFEELKVDWTNYLQENIKGIESIL